MPNAESHEKIFSDIWKNNSWQGVESRSGPSSSLARTEGIRNELPRLISKLDVRVLLDAPCGDFYWMQEVATACSETKFIGLDIVPDLVAANRESFSHLKNVSFTQADLIEHALPSADLMLARDFIFHLSYEDTAKFFRNFLRSGIPFLLTTTHIPGRWQNTDIPTGSWRWMDLLTAPYSFPKPQSFIPDGSDRLLALFSRNEVESAGLISSESGDFFSRDPR